MEKQEAKNVKEVFKDYDSNSFELNAARVVGINLYKSKKELELIIESDKLIKIEDILAMEKYMENRFQVKNARITIKYTFNDVPLTIVGKDESVDINELIKKSWNNIVEYIAFKHPIAKAFLKGSSIDIADKNMKITLTRGGREFLEGNKFNEVFSNILSNVYNRKYVIKYEEAINENEFIQVREEKKKLQARIMQEIVSNIGKEPENNTKEKKNNTKSYDKSNQDLPWADVPPPEMPPMMDMNMPPEMMPQDFGGGFAPAPQAPKPEPKKEEPQEEDKPLIVGRSLNLKDAITKIQDIGVESGNVIIEG